MDEVVVAPKFDDVAIALFELFLLLTNEAQCQAELVPLFHRIHR